MASPAGYRTWATADTVTASDFSAYLQDQVVGVYTSSSNRTTELASPAEGQVSYLTDTNTFEVYNGSAWVALLDADTLSVSSGDYTMTGDLTVGTSNAQILGPASGGATAGNVSYSFSGDTDTGLYRSAANTFHVATGGVLRCTFSATGVVVPGRLTLDPTAGATNEGGEISFQPGSSGVNDFYIDRYDNDLRYIYNGAVVSSLRSDGHLGVGGVASASYELDVHGSAHFLGDVNIPTSNTSIYGPASGAASAGNVSYSFAGDTDTGLYRWNTNTLSMATGGAAVMTWDASQQVGIGQTSPSATLDVVGTMEQDGIIGRLAPTGVVLPFAGGSIPAGWLLCTGTAVSRTTYAHLFAVIGTTYGVGDGSTTFNIPNMQGRVPAGVNTADSDFVSLNTTGGAKTVTLTSSEMPSHTHTQNSHIHYISAPVYGGLVGNTTGTFGTRMDRSNIGISTVDGTSWYATSTTAVNQSTGGGGAHSNLQPYISLYYIIAT